MHELHCLKILVQGKVQGVSFRFYTRKKAQELGIRGWVRNTPEGSVEIEAEGNEQQLATFYSWCARGPVLAKVAQISSVPVPCKGYSGFDIRFN